VKEDAASNKLAQNARAIIFTAYEKLVAKGRETEGAGIAARVGLQIWSPRKRNQRINPDRLASICCKPTCKKIRVTDF